jgi:signal transduction histidine kinase
VGLAAVATAGLLLGRRAVAPLGDALARQRRFVADAAHELRTPLTLLHTRAQVFERTARRGGATDLAAEATQIVADSGRLADVVDDLLLSAELGSRPDRREPVDLSRLAAEVRAAAAAHAAELGIALTGPDDPPPVIVAGAAPALRRAVAALVDNALGHTSRGGSVRVTVNDGDPVTLTVADSGVGLDMSTAGALFDRFARGQDSGDRRRFGLGLALVHEVVTNHHGRVTVAGAPGEGASFTLELPPHPRR